MLIFFVSILCYIFLSLVASLFRFEFFSFLRFVYIFLDDLLFCVDIFLCYFSHDFLLLLRFMVFIFFFFCRFFRLYSYFSQNFSCVFLSSSFQFFLNHFYTILTCVLACWPWFFLFSSGYCVYHCVFCCLLRFFAVILSDFV